MIFSTTSAETLEYDLHNSIHHAILKQFLYATVGLMMTAGVYFLGYKKFLLKSPQLLIVFVVLLALTLIPGIGREVNGSRRWLSLGGISFQPSEFVKYLVPAYIIHRYLVLNVDKIWTFQKFVRLMFLPMMAIFLILVEPNNGTAFVVAMIVLVLCLLTRLPLKYWALPLGILVVVGAVFASQLPYVSARLKSYLDPELDIHGKGHQPYQAKIAVGSGGLFGRGPGNSLQKLSYLPEAQNDYIAAIYAEEFGFVGMLSLISSYAFFACMGFSIGMRASDEAGYYLSGAIIFLVCFQAFMNLGVVSGILPSTGLNLPFFSQGGSSLMANLIGVGLLLSISKHSL